MGEQVKKREAICYANTMSKKLLTITRTQFAVSAFHIFLFVVPGLRCLTYDTTKTVERCPIFVA